MAAIQHGCAPPRGQAGGETRGRHSRTHRMQRCSTRDEIGKASHPPARARRDGVKEAKGGSRCCVTVCMGQACTNGSGTSASPPPWHRGTGTVDSADGTLAGCFEPGKIGDGIGGHEYGCGATSGISGPRSHVGPTGGLSLVGAPGRPSFAIFLAVGPSRPADVPSASGRARRLWPAKPSLTLLHVTLPDVTPPPRPTTAGASFPPPWRWPSM